MVKIHARQLTISICVKLSGLKYIIFWAGVTTVPKAPLIRFPTRLVPVKQELPTCFPALEPVSRDSRDLAHWNHILFVPLYLASPIELNVFKITHVVKLEFHVCVCVCVWFHPLEIII